MRYIINCVMSDVSCVFVDIQYRILDLYLVLRKRKSIAKAKAQKLDNTSKAGVQYRKAVKRTVYPVTPLLHGSRK